MLRILSYSLKNTHRYNSLRLLTKTDHERLLLQSRLIRRHGQYVYSISNKQAKKPSVLVTRRFIQILKHPNKYELLNQARGFVQRLKVRIKYPLMKQMRPFTLNDISALFSWIFLGHTVWLVVGTTSFLSFGLWAANSLQFQEWVVNKMGHFLTLTSEATIVFESATPNWKDGKVRLNHLHVVCMPRSIQKEFRLGTQEKEPAIVQGDVLAHIELDEDEKSLKAQKRLKRMPWYDLTIDSIEVELSLMHLMEGKGIVKNAIVKGVRGIIDNRRSGWNKSTNWDPEAVRKSHIPGDFEIDQLILEDLSVIVYMPKGFRPFPASIIQAQLSRLRRQWLFYDFLCADSIIGSIDSSLFSVHTPQLEKSVLEHSDLESKGNYPSLATYYPFRKLNPLGVFVGGENEQFGMMTDDGMKRQGYKRKSRLRIENISMDHAHRFGDGPPQWITSGTVDFCADIYIPDEAQKEKPPSVPQAILEVIKQSLPLSITIGIGSEKRITLGEKINQKQMIEEPKKVIMDVDIRYKNVKATVPLKIPTLSYLNSAMVRPLIAYLNKNQTIVPIKGRIIMDLSTFNGAWTIHDSTLAIRLNECITKGLVDLVTDQQERNRRLKQIGYWSFREIVRNVVTLHETLYGTARGFWTYLGQ
ncbi:mitochondrial distribution and morphology proteins-domain-containing protein [Cokeromyces recurvatus]|uniref:mitochondrial distribution and morphology proteins-domain-containing protein n=1 Tax=Cokeromyces recurvatus TaxID=90255 RepID=UPI0022204ED1|nr:mitochondrial distribution and morphology proteins-domain-containing protein [Cokeromyces recurvatus]KAI7902174.1 mitochondrial distribution and morphology proteins-domain-containing protein [Cokeromyces recurvatus]